MTNTIVLFKKTMYAGGYMMLSAEVKEDYFIDDDLGIETALPLIIQVECKCKIKRPNGKYDFRIAKFPWQQINVARNRMRTWYDKYFRECQEAWEDYMEADAHYDSEYEDYELPWE